MTNLRLLYFRHHKDAERELSRIGVDPVGVEIMSGKGVFAAVRIDDVPLREALILKQEMLSLGAEAALPRGAASLALRNTSVILMGTLEHYRRLGEKLNRQPFNLKALGEAVWDLVRRELCPPGDKFLVLGKRRFPLGQKTYVMGILNVTPDSFSDGGLYLDVNKAVSHARSMVEMGADIIDIGAESTRPGFTPVSEEEEKRRLIPVLERLREEIDVPISVDTYKPNVAKLALELGADIINDVRGLSEPGMAEVIAEKGAAAVIMHSREEPVYRDLLGEIMAELSAAVNKALEAGISREKIIIDPGFGFGKTREQNLALLYRLGELRSLGFPILVGTSRKSMIGRTLNLPVNERLEGTAATVTMSIERGADIIRVHDVREMSRVARMTDAVVRRCWDV